MDFNLYNLNNLKKLPLNNLTLNKKFKPAAKPSCLKRANTLLKSSFNWLIPKLCISCKQELAQENHPCCLTCYANLAFQSHCCSQCGQVYSGTSDYCGRCIIKTPPFDACFCPFEYQGPIKEQIKAFKYKAKPELAKTLAQLLYHEIIANDLPRPDLLIPVPMHISKLRDRGYNQSLLLTQQLSKLIAIPYNRHILVKHKATPAQAELSLKQRQTSVKGCFKVTEKAFIDQMYRKSKHKHKIKHIAIIDDVFTTGATASEIAKVLKRKGVNYVEIWGIAHTV